MDVQWMQNFLCLPPCDVRPSGADMPVKTNRLHSLDNLEGDDGVRPDYTCPFCYEDFDIVTLCSHLEDDHCYESNSAACPVCATKIAKDLVGHITLQHGFLFKMQRRRSRKAGASSNTSLPLSFLDDVSKPIAASEEDSAKSSAFNIQQKIGVGTSEECRQEPEEEALRAKFVQHLLLSLIVPES